MKPSSEVLLKLDTVVRLLFERMLANIIQSNRLASLRDLLLSRPLSGEIRVPVAEKLVGEAV